MNEHTLIAVYGNSYVTTTAINLAAEIAAENKSLKVILVSLDSTKPIMSVIFPNDDDCPSLGNLMASPDDMSDELLLSNLKVNSDNVCVLGYAKEENINTYAKPVPDRIDDMFMYLRNLADVTIIDCTSDIASSLYTAKAIIAADKVVNLISADIFGAAFYTSQKPMLLGTQYGFFEKFIPCLTSGEAIINDTGRFEQLMEGKVCTVVPYSKKAVEIINTGAALTPVSDRRYRNALRDIITATTTEIKE